MTQPEALRLADALASWEYTSTGLCGQAAAELRRLYDLADKYKWQVIDTCARAEKAEAQRDALLEALKLSLRLLRTHVEPEAVGAERFDLTDSKKLAPVFAAIANVKGNT